MESTERSGRGQSATERRRRELLEAAERIVLRDGPDASMNAIAAEAGITKPILYRHFGDKGGSTARWPYGTPTPCWPICVPRWTPPSCAATGSRPPWTPICSRSRPARRCTAS